MNSKSDAAGKSNSSGSQAADAGQEVAQALAGDNSLDTVREILFGKQVRKTETRSKELENLIKASIKDLDQKTEARFKALQKDLDQFRKDLAKARDKTASQVAEEFANTRDKIAALESATKASQNELYETLDTARLALEADARSWNEELGRQLDEVHAKLGHEKTDRAALAGLLQTMARELADPDKDG
jgi:chromosome segregation ATPase